MMITLYIAVSAGIFLLEKKACKKHLLSTIILIVGLAILMGANQTIADTYIYMKRYSESVNWSVTNAQWAMSLFMHICNLMGLTYIQFRIFFFIVGLSIICYSVSKVTDEFYVFFIAYFLYTMVIDAAQIKNFMAMAIVSLAITYLTNSNAKNNIKYILLVFLAAGFQITAYAYMPLVIFCNAAIKRKYRALACVPVVLFALLFSNRWTSRYLSNVLLSTIKGDLLERSGRFIAKSVNNGYLVYFLATILIIYITLKLKSQVENSLSASEWEKKFSDVVFLCSIYSLTFVPLYFYAQDFSRLLRNFAIVNHMLFFLAIKCRKNDASMQGTTRQKFVIEKRALINVVYAGYLLYMFYWDVAVYMDTVVTPFFRGNLYL